MSPAVRRSALALGVVVALVLGGAAAAIPAAAATKPTLRVYDARLTEGTGGQAIVAFSVRLSKKTTKPVTFTWGTRKGSASAAADDFTAMIKKKVTIRAGRTSAVLIVRVAADDLDEYTETFGVHLSGASSNVRIADADGSATILDDDAAPILEVQGDDIVEGTDPGPRQRTVVASLSAPSGKPVSVRYSVSGGTATVGGDLVARRATLTFAPGRQDASATFDVVGDATEEATETFALTWSAPVNVRLPARSTPRTLRDDDRPTNPVILGTNPEGPSPEAQPLLFGIAPPGSTVEVFRNGSCSGSAIASGPSDVFVAGGFAVPMTPNATNTLTVRGTNTVSGIDTDCSAPLTYRHDDLAPNAPNGLQAVPGTPTQDLTPTLRGTAEAGSTVNVYVDTDCSGTPVSTGTAADFGDANGLSLGSLTANTSHSVRVTATDAAGNVSACSPPFTVTIDTVDPAAPTGLTVLPAAVTSDSTPVLQGTAEAGSTVQVFVDAVCTGTPQESGTAAEFLSPGITLSSALADGDHVLRARAVDGAGNVGACSGGVDVTIDTGGPADPVGLAVSPASVTTDATPLFSGSVEVGSSVGIWVDSGCGGAADVTGTRGEFAAGIAVGPLSEATHQLYARAVDGAGNVSGCAGPVQVTVDQTDPLAPTGLTVLPAAVTSDSTPVLQGTAEAGSTVQVFVDAVCTGTPHDTGTAAAFDSPGITLSPALADGDHVLRARAVDDAGNVGACSGGVDVTIDTGGPADPVGLAVSPASVTTDATPLFSGSVEVGSSVGIWVDSGCGGAADVTGTRGEFAAGIAVGPLSEATHQLYARAVDGAGNVSGCAGPVQVTVDQTDPLAPTGLTVLPAAVTSDSTPVLQGTAEAGSTVQVFVDAVCTGTPHDTGTAAAFDSPGITLSPALADGVYVLRARAVDDAGNVGACSGGVDVTIDTATPAAPVINAVLPAPLLETDPPLVTGTAEAGSLVRLYSSSDCTSGFAGSGPESLFSGAGIAIASRPAGTYDLYAEAVDDALNVSACSATFTFVVQ